MHNFYLISILHAMAIRNCKLNTSEKSYIYKRLIPKRDTSDQTTRGREWDMTAHLDYDYMTAESSRRNDDGNGMVFSFFQKRIWDWDEICWAMRYIVCCMVCPLLPSPQAVVTIHNYGRAFSKKMNMNVNRYYNWIVWVDTASFYLYQPQNI